MHYYKAALILTGTGLLLSSLTTAKVAANEISISATECSVAGGRDVSNNVLNCYFGLTPEQLKQLTEAAVKGATEPLMDRIIAISKKLGVTEDAGENLLKIVGNEHDVPEDKLAAALNAVANDYKRLQEQAAALKPENPTAGKLIAEARAEIDGGHFAGAHRLLAAATQAQVAAAQDALKVRDQAQTAANAQMLGAAESTAADAGVALTERRYLQAAELFEQAAKYVPAGYPNEHRGYVLRQANALFNEGDERGGSEALQRSIVLYRSILQGLSRERIPLDWALAQNSLGYALLVLGERESGSARLEEAISSFRAALEVDTREQMPRQWAMTQRNLGYALLVLGHRESGTAVEEAVLADRAALEEITREKDPFQWAQLQIGLGNALGELGARERGTERLDQAISAYRAALGVVTRERAPRPWAGAQFGLGIALLALGKRERGSSARLEEAISSFRLALAVYTRDRLPVAWATTQARLGGALLVLGERERGSERLEEAVSAFRATLEIRTRDGTPQLWAYSMDQLANALAILAIRTGDATRLQEAIACMRGAVEVYRQEPNGYFLPIAEGRLAEMTAQLTALKQR
jgi:tetratricopeptide (TPR) repeat protein